MAATFIIYWQEFASSKTSNAGKDITFGDKQKSTRHKWEIAWFEIFKSLLSLTHY